MGVRKLEKTFITIISAKIVYSTPDKQYKQKNLFIV